jgi:hypothetical protein
LEEVAVKTENHATMAESNALENKQKKEKKKPHKM